MKTISVEIRTPEALILQGDYEFVESDNPDLDHNVLLFQLAYGF